MIKEMSIGLETYSDVDISKYGAYKYTDSDNFEILLFGVSVDGAPVKVYDLACGDTIPEDILAAISDETAIKWAFNAAFKRIWLSNWLKKNILCTLSVTASPKILPVNIRILHQGNVL